MGRWVWNTRLGTYEWRESSFNVLGWVAAIALVALFGALVVFGIAIVRQMFATDSSTVARVFVAGDYGSLARWVLELGPWALAIGSTTLQQYWPFMLIGVPAVIGLWVLRKG